MVKVAVVLMTGELGRSGFVAVQATDPVSDLCTDAIARELETCWGVVWLRTEVWMITLDDVMTVSPFMVQVMEAGGRLPEWMQKKKTSDPSSTVWLSGSDTKVFRMTIMRREVCQLSGLCHTT